MTTYSLKQGLRHALMKLESSASSNNGSMLNQIVDFRHPEERMAARLVERLQLEPPIDVEKLCKSFAHLSFKNFPIEIDGLCLDLKVPGAKPKVWVSMDTAHVRRRFTIAHEIGHIIIPWHVGMIPDDIDAPRGSAEPGYREIEAEANRFAAELLMPSAWVAGLAERAEHCAPLMHSIREIADVSYPAAFFKTAKLGQPGFVCAEVKDGVVVRSKRTVGTHSRPPKVGEPVASVAMFAAEEPKVLSSNGADYYWWRIRERLADHGRELESWREILESMLLELPPEFRSKTQQSLNAIIGKAIGREPKGGDVQTMYRLGLEVSQNRDNTNPWLKHVIEHERFKDYVLARARERANTV